MNSNDNAKHGGGEGAACRVMREGEVVRRDAARLWLRVQGRDIPIAADKADPALRIGDRARWNGSKWTAPDAGRDDGQSPAGQ